MQSNPGRRLLNASIDQFPALMGKLALQASNEYLFGGKEERESVQRYRLFQQGLESPAARSEYAELYGGFNPSKPPEMPKSLTSEMGTAVTKAPASPTEIKPAGLIRGIEGEERSRGKSFPEGIKGTSKDITDLINEDNEIDEKSAIERFNSIKGIKDSTKKSAAFSQLFSDLQKEALPSPSQTQITRTRTPAAKEAPEERPVFKTYMQIAEENEKVPYDPGQWDTKQGQRSDRVRKAANSLRSRGEKDLRAFESAATKFVEDYNKRGVRMKDVGVRSNYVNKNMISLAKKLSTLPDPEREAGYAALESAFNRVVGEDVFEFERGILDNYGKVGELSTFAPRVFKNYNNTPRTTDVTKQAKAASLSLQKVDKELGNAMSSYEALGGDEEFKRLGGMKALEDSLGVPGVSGPDTSPNAKKLQQLARQKKEIQTLNGRRRHFYGELQSALKDPNTAVRIPTMPITLATGEEITIYNPEGTDLSKTSQQYQDADSARTLSALYGSPEGATERATALDSLSENHPDVFQRVMRETDGKTQKEKNDALARAVTNLGIQTGVTARGKADAETVNRVENAKRFQILPQIPMEATSEAMLGFDTDRGLPPGTTEKVVSGTPLSDNEMKAVAALSQSSVRRPDPNYDEAKRKNPWLDELTYYRLPIEKRQILARQSKASLDNLSVGK